MNDTFGWRGSALIMLLAGNAVMSLRVGTSHNLRRWRGWISHDLIWTLSNCCSCFNFYLALVSSPSFLSSLVTQIPEEGETITSTRLSEVAFYEAAFLEGLRFPIHLPILQYMPCLACPQCVAKRHLCNIVVVSISICHGTLRVQDPIQAEQQSQVRPRLAVLQGEGRPAGDASTSSGDTGESVHSRDELFRGGHSGDSSIECIGIIRWTDRAFSHLPNQILLSVLTGEIRPILGAWELGRLSLSLHSLSSSSSSGAMAESWLPFELKLDAMSKRTSFKKLGQNVEKSKAENPTTKPTPAKGLVIGEKRPRDKSASSPTKKGETTGSSKGKEPAPQSEPKKKMAATKSCNVASSEAILVRKSGEGPTEKVKHLTYDQTATSFFHILGQALVFGSSLVARGREGLEEFAFQQGRAASLEGEVSTSSNFLAIWRGNLPAGRRRADQSVLDNGDVHNDDQDALSYSNEWAFFIMAISTMAIKMPYHIVMNRHSS
ncbi:hypothetical protein Acr_26g0000780 [Actinidia rufa]|uniref:Uncharacterized protein n=1 Tax=Actinidia rufa TaxID=165716 RepID=A0A7J0H1B9_9ERIC|nr:hypothetical protein Acr_26g0000780 [Actinidia rufa]